MIHGCLMTDNKLGDEGTKVLSESLKVDTTLLNFNLWSFWISHHRWMKGLLMSQELTDNGIGPEGAKSIAESLRLNGKVWYLTLQSD